MEWIVTNKDLITAWTAILAVVVSTISVGIAISNMKLQRIHNRKTLLPIGTISLGDYEQLLVVRLNNDGAGPLIIDDVSVIQSADNKKVGTALIDLMPSGVTWATFVNDIRGRAFRPGSEIELVKWEADEEDPAHVEERRRIREALYPLSVRVDYRSVYDEKRAVERRLDWFGRQIGLGPYARTRRP